MIKVIILSLLFTSILFSESFSEQFPFIMHTVNGDKEAALKLLHPDFTVRDLDKDSYKESFYEIFDQSRKMKVNGQNINIDQHFIVTADTIPTFPIDSLTDQLNGDFKKFFKRPKYANMKENQIAVYITIRINDGDPIDGLIYLFEEVEGNLLALHLDD